MRRLMKVTVVNFEDGTKKLFPAKTAIADILAAHGGNMTGIKSVTTETRLFTMEDEKFMELAECKAEDHVEPEPKKTKKEPKK